MSAIRPRTISELRLGTIVVIVAVIAGLVLFQKQRLTTSLKPGETIHAEFASNHRITPFQAVVKIAGVPIGNVTTVEHSDNGGTRMGLKVKSEALDLMGTAPSVAVRPTTLLGGNYYIDVVPGGRRGHFDGTVPASRTEIPVELDSIAATLNTPAREGARSAIADLGGALGDEGSKALQDLSSTAPDSLDPAAAVLGATRGTSPGTDLPRLVRGFESTSRVLSEKNGQLDSSVTNLARLTAVLDARRSDEREALKYAPDTLQSTEKMLVRLRKTLDTLEKTSDDIRPSVQALDELLDDIDPVLVEARPAIGDLRTVSRDLRPVLDDLTPVADDLTAVLNNLRGPVLNRTNGQILPALNNGWTGSGLYEGTSGNTPMYKEIGYTLSGLAQATMSDANGSGVDFSAGIGPGSAIGLPISSAALTNLLMAIIGGAQ